MIHTWLRDEGGALLSRQQAPPFETCCCCCCRRVCWRRLSGPWLERADVQNFDVAATEATAKEFMNIGLGFDETQYGELPKYLFCLVVVLRTWIESATGVHHTVHIDINNVFRYTVFWLERYCVNVMYSAWGDSVLCVRL